MSKALDLLRRLASGDNRGDFFISLELLKEVEAILGQPEPLTPREGLEEYKRGYARAELDLKREPLSDDEIEKFWKDNFYNGINFYARAIEKAHGIGGGE